MEHAMSRALERYGLKLSYSDMTDIAASCAQGYGRLAILQGGIERHLVECHGKTIVVIYKPPSQGARFEKGDVITILPKEAALATPRRWHGPDRRKTKRRK